MNKLNKILSIADENQSSVPAIKTENEVVEVDKQTQNDYEYARENIYSAIEKSAEAIEQMTEIAQQSQHPKAYEVLNQMIKTLVDASNTLTDHHIKKHKLLQKPKEDQEQKTINNNLFVGSTAELQKVLEDMRSK